MLAALDDAGTVWGIVTNKPEYLARLILPQHGWQQRCAVLVGGDSLAERKPHPLPLLHAAQAIAVAAEDCVYVGTTSVTSSPHARPRCRRWRRCGATACTVTTRWPGRPTCWSRTPNFCNWPVSGRPGRQPRPSRKEPRSEQYRAGRFPRRSGAAAGRNGRWPPVRGRITTRAGSGVVCAAAGVRRHAQHQRRSAAGRRQAGVVGRGTAQLGGTPFAPPAGPPAGAGACAVGAPGRALPDLVEARTVALDVAGAERALAHYADAVAAVEVALFADKPRTGAGRAVRRRPWPSACRMPAWPVCRAACWMKIPVRPRMGATPVEGVGHPRARPARAPRVVQPGACTPGGAGRGQSRSKPPRAHPAARGVWWSARLIQRTG